SMAELERLTNTAGAIVVGSASQKLSSPNARTFIGSGKAKEIAELAKSMEADVVIFDDELSPSQQTNLESIFKGCKVIDRTALILDIFALHAISREGRLQVRLAQNQYLLPRLRGMWAHLASNRMGGGVGSRFGEGESQLEVDRRMARKRISMIKQELKTLSTSRDLQRKARADSGVYRVALAGYTNAGKSSLLNRLTEADVLVYDKLFATLDSTTRKFVLPEGREITITDTVGFIQKIPTNLVEAFKSTLAEISGADLILHVTDSNSPQRAAQMQAVRDVLQQIGAEKIPVLEVFNKADLLEEGERLSLANRYPASIQVSALTGEGFDKLIERISFAASSSSKLLTILIPYTRGDLVQMAHERCGVSSETFTEDGTVLTVLVPKPYVSRFEQYVIPKEENSEL
ncbi:MAG: GTPase HflX, partial [Actinobacteria bacterium]|nr:GTPase HflX [Actinomycetota bacterium]